MATKDDLRNRITKFIKDVATLDVVTLTGKIDLTTLQPPDKAISGKEEDSIDWDNLFEKLATGMKANADIKVVAYTHSEFDCDAITFVKESATKEELVLVEHHNKAVEAAHRSRFEALQFIGKAIGTL